MAEWIGIGILTLGLIFTWIRNGKTQRNQDLKLTNERTRANAELSNKVENLRVSVEQLAFECKDVVKSVSSFKENCAMVSTSLKERIIAIEGERRKES